MSYLLDKKIQRKKIFRITFGVVVFMVLIYFRSGIFDGLSYVGHKFFRPILVVGDSIDGKFKSFGSYFAFKNYLNEQNQKLQSQVKENDARMANYDSVVAENTSLKETLNRKDPKISMTLSAILSKPNQSAYDTLIIDGGSKQGIKVGNIVFALGNVPIGRVALVYDSSAKVILFSTAGEKTQAMITGKNIFMELLGRGGGNFEMILPKDLTLQDGDQVIMPGINSYVLAIVKTTISDPRDPFTKALLTSPVNIEELQFVEVEK
jgi:cell shape-determining protein MreC